VSRLERLRIPSDAIEPDELADAASDNDPNTERADAGDVTPTRSGSPMRDAFGNDGVPEVDSSVQDTYDVVLAATRIYRRVEDREVDAISSVSTNRSHAWSALSGLSLAQVSTVAVIQLPLYQPELERFWRLASPSTMDSLSTLAEPSVSQQNSLGTYSGLFTGRRSQVQHEYPHHTDGWLREYGIISEWGITPGPDGTARGTLTRIHKELKNIECDPPGMLSVGPIGDEMVYTTTSLSFLSRLTTTSSIGKVLSRVLYVCRPTCNAQG
jgi:hypothetical protein